MIVDLLLQILIAFFTWAISLLPVFTGLPQGLEQAFIWLAERYSDATAIFPVTTLLQIISLVIAFELGMFVWKSIWFIYHKIPGKFS